MRLFVIFLSVILISINSYSGTELEEAEAVTAEAVKSELAEVVPASIAVKSFDSTKLWLGPTLSLFVGYGVGVGVQGNYEQRGWIYTSADMFTLFLIWKSITDCHSPNHHSPDCPMDSNRRQARNLFVTSRILQIVDSSIWSFKYYNKYKSAAFILPKEGGLSLNYAIEF